MAFIEQADGSQSRQMAEITKAAHKDGDFVAIEYTRTDTETPKTGVIAKTFVKGMAQELEAKLRALKVGDKCVVVKTKAGKFYNFTGIEDASTFVAPVKKAFTPFGGGAGGKAPYDQVGAKVGGILHDATALAVAAHGTAVKVAHVGAIAREMLALSIQLEAETRGGEHTATKATTTTKATPKVEDKSIFDDDTTLESSNIWATE